MKTKKNLLRLAFLAVTPALLAADPVSPAPATPAAPATPEVGAAATSFPEDLADQAGLVQQIGAQAARGFDVEAHARALREQIEALVSGAAACSSRPSTNQQPKQVTATTRAKPTAPAAPNSSPSTAPDDAAVRQALSKMRAALDDLEQQLHR